MTDLDGNFVEQSNDCARHVCDHLGLDYKWPDARFMWLADQFQSVLLSQREKFTTEFEKHDAQVRAEATEDALALRSCERCGKTQECVLVETGFAGEDELVCGPCLGIERTEAESALAEAQKERDAWKREFEMYRSAWLREIGGEIRRKTHEIDGFVLRTRDIYEGYKKAVALQGALRKAKDILEKLNTDDRQQPWVEAALAAARKALGA